MNSSWLFVRSIVCVIPLWVSGCVRAVYTMNNHQKAAQAASACAASVDQAVRPICFDPSAYMSLPIVCPSGAVCKGNNHLVCSDCLIKVFAMYQGISYCCPICEQL